MTRNLQIENEVIVWGGDDPFTHTLVVGPTRCGKTATILKPLIYQILKAKKEGRKVGLSVIEPKGDVARMVKEMAEDMDLHDELTYIDPLYPDETHRINVMRGEKNDVAEATVAVLKSLFGKQDAFFATVQELSSRKVTLLLKELYNDDMTIMDVLANLRDADTLRNNVELLRKRNGTDDLISFFDNELLGTGTMADKYRQFIVGLRAQLENITANDHLRAIVAGKSDIDLDEHFAKGGILAVNTALGLLGSSGDAFGMFIAMHLQLATFRRRGTERTRVPHYLIIDEYSRYINPDVERFLSIAAEYRVALIAAIQSLGQLELESGKMSGRAMKRAIMTSTRNKIVFGGLDYEDAKEVSLSMGSNIMKERVRTFDGGILQNILPKMYKEEDVEKERFHYTQLMDGLPKFHYVHKLLKDGTPQEPGVAVGDFVPLNWKAELEAEVENLKNKCVTNRKRPPVWKIIDRMKYDVDLFEYKVEQKKTEEIKKKLARNPFESEDITPEGKNEQFKRAFKKTETNVAPINVGLGQTTTKTDVTVDEKPDYSKVIFSINKPKLKTDVLVVKKELHDKNELSNADKLIPRIETEARKVTMPEPSVFFDEIQTPVQIADNKQQITPSQQTSKNKDDVQFTISEQDLYLETSSISSQTADESSLDTNGSTAGKEDGYLTNDQETGFW